MSDARKKIESVAAKYLKALRKEAIENHQLYFGKCPYCLFDICRCRIKFAPKR